MTSFSVSLPIRVGLVGTGYAAKLRAETVNADSRAKLVGVAGHTPEKTQEFGHVYQTQSFSVWAELVENAHIDLVIVSSDRCKFFSVFTSFTWQKPQWESISPIATRLQHSSSFPSKHSSVIIRSRYD